VECPGPVSRVHISWPPGDVLATCALRNPPHSLARTQLHHDGAFQRKWPSLRINHNEQYFCNKCVERAAIWGLGDENFAALLFLGKLLFCFGLGEAQKQKKRKIMDANGGPKKARYIDFRGCVYTHTLQL